MARLPNSPLVSIAWFDCSRILVQLATWSGVCSAFHVTNSICNQLQLFWYHCAHLTAVSRAWHDGSYSIFFCHCFYQWFAVCEIDLICVSSPNSNVLKCSHQRYGLIMKRIGCGISCICCLNEVSFNRYPPCFFGPRRHLPAQLASLVLTVLIHATGISVFLFENFFISCFLETPK